MSISELKDSDMVDDRDNALFHRNIEKVELSMAVNPDCGPKQKVTLRPELDQVSLEGDDIVCEVGVPSVKSRYFRALKDNGRYDELDRDEFDNLSNDEFVIYYLTDFSVKIYDKDYDYIKLYGYDHDVNVRGFIKFRLH